MRITLLGCGALGGLVGARLARSGNEIQILQRPGSTLKRLRAQGLALDDAGTVRTWPVRAEADPSQLEPARLVLVTVKSYVTADVAPLLTDLLDDDGLVLTLQNGLGNAEQLACIVGTERVAAASCTYGAYRDGEGMVHVGGEGEIRFGPMRPGKDWTVIEELLNGSGLKATFVYDPRPDLWSKLVANAAINPVSALIRRENGHILACAETSRLAKTLTMEACRVARAEGMPFGEGEMWPKVRLIIQGTSHNKSSMLQDILAGRPTEIEAISGEVLRRGRAFDLILPATATVRALIRGLES
jgi:2-dehydropantoate 2-reductase